MRQHWANAFLLCAAIYLGACDRVATAQPNDCTAWNTIRFFAVATAPDVMRCLENGADVNARTKSGETPLHAASHYGTAETVNALLNAGADVNARTKSGETPLHNAFAVRIVPIESWVNYMSVDLDAAETVEIVAEIVNALLNAGADVNARDNRDNTPLHEAADMWSVSKPMIEIVVEIVNDLLKAGADVNARNDNSYTPLHYASGYGTAETVNALLNAGADVNARTKSGETRLKKRMGRR